jgi:hypothetical protein
MIVDFSRDILSCGTQVFVYAFVHVTCLCVYVNMVCQRCMLYNDMYSHNTQNSPRPGLGGSHHLPPYSILYAFPRGPHPNGILSWDSQVGVPKFPDSGLPRLWGPITFSPDLPLIWGLKQSCSPRQELSNNMWQVTYTQGNRVDSRLLMFGPSFEHNLCFKCPNGLCELISDIYDSRASLLACTLASPCFGREPKARVATVSLFEFPWIYLNIL